MIKRLSFYLITIAFTVAVLELLAFAVTKLVDQDDFFDTRQIVYARMTKEKLAGFRSRVADAVTGWRTWGPLVEEGEDCLGQPVAFSYDSAGARIHNGFDAGQTKIVIVGDNPHPVTTNQKEMDAFELRRCLEGKTGLAAGERELLTALAASEAGIPRCHVIDGHQDGALLAELFTRDGVGTLIARDRYDTFRPARPDDINGILALLQPLEERGILVRRDREKLENEISHFHVNERDGMIVGCAALYLIPDTVPQVAELACVAVHQDYRQSGRGDALLRALEKRAREHKVERLFVLTTQTAHWFAERGFESAPVAELPPERQSLYNFQRNSKVFFKSL